MEIYLPANTDPSTWCRRQAKLLQKRAENWGAYPRYMGGYPPSSLDDHPGCVGFRAFSETFPQANFTVWFIIEESGKVLREIVTEDETGRRVIDQIVPQPSNEE